MSGSFNGHADVFAILDEPMDWSTCLRKADPEEAEALLGLLEAMRDANFRDIVSNWVGVHCPEFHREDDEHRLEWTQLHKEFISMFESCAEAYFSSAGLPQEDYLMILAGWRGQTITSSGLGSDVCPVGHALKDIAIVDVARECDHCARDIHLREIRKHCDMCDYDLCSDCQEKLISRNERLALARLTQILLAPADYEAFVHLMRRVAFAQVSDPYRREAGFFENAKAEANPLEAWGIMLQEFYGSEQFGQGYLDVRAGEYVYLQSAHDNVWSMGQVHRANGWTQGWIPRSFWQPAELNG